MSKSFLPDGYKVPKLGGGYTKLVEGANRFRILCSPIMGWEYWNTENKPVRVLQQPEGNPADLRWDTDKKTGKKVPSRIKHFWAFVVWNYGSKALEILEITQTTIQGQLTDLVQSEDWGDPREYDITINRKGSDLDTEYTVLPGKPVPLNPIVKHDFEKKGINLEALFDGGNPFEAAGGPAQVDGAEDFPEGEDEPIEAH
jgi:hypothetical protein